MQPRDSDPKGIYCNRCCVYHEGECPVPAQERKKELDRLAEVAWAAFMTGWRDWTQDMPYTLPAEDAYKFAEAFLAEKESRTNDTDA